MATQRTTWTTQNDKDARNNVCQLMKKLGEEDYELKKKAKETKADVWTALCKKHRGCEVTYKTKYFGGIEPNACVAKSELEGHFADWYYGEALKLIREKAV